jgi:hypothetical protein
MNDRRVGQWIIIGKDNAFMLRLKKVAARQRAAFRNEVDFGLVWLFSAKIYCSSKIFDMTKSHLPRCTEHKPLRTNYYKSFIRVFFSSTLAAISCL